MKIIFAVLMVVALVLLDTTGARADQVSITTNATEGCFTSSTSCTPSSTTPNDGNGLSFTGNGAGPIGLQTGNGSGSTRTVELGYFSLNDPWRSYDQYSENFDALVTFQTPPGSGSDTITASVSGQIFWGNGSVTINFGNTPVLINYDGGSFDLTVSDPDPLGNDSSVDLDGTLSNLTTDPTSPAPEPATLGLLGTGLLGLVGAFRRKLSL